MAEEHDKTPLDLLKLWFGFSEPVDRKLYALTGFTLMALKYMVDSGVIYLAEGKLWTPLDYLNPIFVLRDEAAGYLSDGLIFAMAAWTIPFIWIGASMTIRRSMNAGFSPWVGLLFFIPIINYIVMLCLCFAPEAVRVDVVAEADPGEASDQDPSASLAMNSIAAGVVVGLGMMLLSAMP